MQPLGTINVDELIIPITQVQLEHGAILFRGRLRGPLKASQGTRSYAIHGVDGRVVYRAHGIAGLSWPAVDALSWLDIVCPMQVHGDERQRPLNVTGPVEELQRWPLLNF